MSKVTVKCPKCGCSVLEQRLQKHLLKAHEQLPDGFLCPRCSKLVTDLDRHIATKHPPTATKRRPQERPVLCTCGAAVLFTEMLEHQRKTHGPTLLNPNEILERTVASRRPNVDSSRRERNLYASHPLHDDYGDEGLA